VVLEQTLVVRDTVLAVHETRSRTQISNRHSFCGPSNRLPGCQLQLHDCRQPTGCPRAGEAKSVHTRAGSANVGQKSCRSGGRRTRPCEAQCGTFWRLEGREEDLVGRGEVPWHDVVEFGRAAWSHDFPLLSALSHASQNGKASSVESSVPIIGSRTDGRRAPYPLHARCDRLFFDC
jgi:hypothetical protein